MARRDRTGESIDIIEGGPQLEDFNANLRCDWLECGKNCKPGTIFLLMELPINDKELNTIVSALRLGGDVALYQKMIRVQEVRAKNSKSENEQFGFVL